MSVGVAVMSRAPVPGETKRRLIPAVGADRAAAIHCRMLEHTLTTALHAGIGPVRLWCTPTVQHPFFQSLAQRRGISRERQAPGPLGERMYQALAATLPGQHGAIVVGSDCPGLRVSDFESAAARLESGVDAVLGPSADGGYYLLGIRHLERSLFQGIPWGEPRVAALTRTRLRALQLSWRELAVRTDVDRGEDLAAYPGLRCG